MESGNIVRGRIRRYAAVHGHTINPCEFKTREIPNTDKEFPAGLRVQHKINGKTGTVQKDFGGPVAGLYYDPWEIPVIWDGEKILHGINHENLIKL